MFEHKSGYSVFNIDDIPLYIDKSGEASFKWSCDMQLITTKEVDKTTTKVVCEYTTNGDVIYPLWDMYK